MMPIRLEVLKRLCALIEVSQGEDHLGNSFNLAGSVYRGRVEFGS